MRPRTEDTLSERQLILALAKSGRTVSLGRLTAWRKDGLLPPLASTGSGAGRTYYWRKPDILQQAEAVHDGLRRHGRAELVTLTLWLRGFGMPVSKLRRAWLSIIRARKAPSIRRTSPAPPLPAGDLSGLLLQAVSGTAALVQLGDKPRAAIALLEAAAARLDIAPGERIQQVRQFWQMAQVMTSVLAASDLLRQANDDEMTKAQALLRRALAFIADSSGESDSAVSDLLGETLFLYILALLRSGQDALLETAQARLEAATRRLPAQPQPLYAQA